MKAPHWKIVVLTSSGEPIPNISVREEANDYSCGGPEQEETLLTNAQGAVEFLQKYKRVNLFSCVGATLSSATAGAHASFGRDAYVFALGAGDGDVVDKRGEVYSWKGSPSELQSRIVMKP
jgi:hypothetical protein